MAAIKRKKEDATSSSAATKKSKTGSDKKEKVKSNKKQIEEVEVKEPKSKKVKEAEVTVEKLSLKEKKGKNLPKSKAAKKVVDKETEGDSSDEWSEDDDDEMGGASLGDAAEDDEEGDELDGEGDVDMDSAPAEASSGKSREAHATQKKLAAERKAARPNADLVSQSKHIWEQVRRRNLPKPERKKLLTDLCVLIKGHVKELVFKHDASRILQTIMKNGTKEQKAAITDELKGKYIALAQSTYGRFLLVKMMFYGDAQRKSAIISEFFGHIRNLIKHKEASIVVEDTWQFANPKEKERMIREFYGVEFAIFKDNSDKATGSLQKILEESPEKRAVIMKSLFALLQTLVQKDAIAYSIVHRALLEYIKNATPGTLEITEFLEMVKEHLVDLAFTKSGSHVVQLCIAYGTAKDRKVMLKTLKPIIARLAEHEAGHKIILAMFDFVDDTKLVAKTFISEIEPVILSVARSNWGEKTLLYALIGKRSWLFHPTQLQALESLEVIRKTTSKKDPETRTLEHITNLTPFYLKAITENTKELMEDPYASKFVLQAIFSAASVPSEEKALKTALEAIAEASKGDPQDESHVINSRGAGKLLKSLVAGGPFDFTTKTVQVISPPLNFHTTLYDAVSPELGNWATGKGIYVVMALMEAEGFEEKDEVKTILNRNMKKLKEIAKENKGAATLIEMLK